MDHRQRRFVKGLNLVSLRYQAVELAGNIAGELIENTEVVLDLKKHETKAQDMYTQNEYLRAMGRLALPGWPQQQVAYRYPLTDSWYASAENQNTILALDNDFVGALESSRTVAHGEAAQAQGRSQALDTLTFPDVQPLCVFLQSVPSDTRDQTSLSRQRW